MSTSLAYKHSIRALSRWPADKFRPDCQLPDIIRRRVERRLNPVSPANTEAKDAKVAAPTAWNEEAELANVNVMYSLLENRYSRKYPLTGSLMKPASNPAHYTDLIEELDKALTRTWLERTINKWKGFIRFQ